jgi:hypothetical protein
VVDYVAPEDRALGAALGEDRKIAWGVSKRGLQPYTLANFMVYQDVGFDQFRAPRFVNWQHGIPKAARVVVFQLLFGEVLEVGA